MQNCNVTASLEREIKSLLGNREIICSNSDMLLINLQMHHHIFELVHLSLPTPSAFHEL